MRKLLLLLALLLPSIAAAGNGPYERVYGVATTIDFELYDSAGLLSLSEVDGGEVTMSCDEATETGTGIGTFTDEGTFYSIALDASAMSCARIVVIVAAPVVVTFVVETCCHPDAAIVSYDPIITSGTTQATAATLTTTTLASVESIADDLLNNYIMKIVGGTGGDPKQSVCIIDWTNTGDLAVHTSLHTVVDATSKYIVTTERCVAQTCSNGNCDANVILIEGSDATDQINAAADQALVDADISKLVVATGTCDSGTTTTCVDAAAFTTADADYYAKGFAMLFTSGTLNGQSACIYDFNVAADRVTFRPALTQAVSTHTYALLAEPICALVISP